MSLLAGEAGDLLSAVNQVYVGVRTRRGPHVTPELFTVAGGRIWCMTAVTTLKARVLRRDGIVAVCASAPDGSVAFLGRATVIDALRPRDAARDAGTAVGAVEGVARFVAGNAAELTGAVASFFAGKLGDGLPPRRAAVAVEPFAVAVARDTGVVVAGNWNTTECSGARGEQCDGDGDAGTADHPVPDDLDTLPDEFRRLARSGPAVLGWSTRGGAPLALPCAWDEPTATARVSRQLLDLVGAAPRSAAGVTRDEWTGFGPEGKQGILLRGDGAVEDGDEDHAVVRMTVRRATRWDGVHTATETL